ncbi:MAG TPA: hypothetical protein VKM55_07240 [Candidatus Lokiarchaeia archaeon]|nr:hypothetical protein [Candidatus Lokiarchaeia archaeon]
MVSSRFTRLGHVLRAIWTGTASKAIMGMYLAISFGIYFAGMLIAAALYPGGYSMFTVYVSFLGGPGENTTGYLVYDICQFITGVLLVPFFFYLYRRFQPDLKVANIISACFGILGCAGFSSISINVQGSHPSWAHGASTWVAFGGLGFCFIFALLVMIRRIALRRQRPRWWHLVVVFGEIFGILGVMQLFTGSPELFASWHLDPGFFKADFFWEYIEVFMAIGAVILFWAITESIRQGEKKNY